MNIYVDYDDCLCETARAFTVIAERLFGKTVPYETVRFFNLQDSFELTDEEYDNPYALIPFLESKKIYKTNDGRYYLTNSYCRNYFPG